MHVNINALLNFLVHLGLLDKVTAEKLYEESKNATWPEDFEAGFQTVKSIFDKADVDLKTATSNKKVDSK